MATLIQATYAYQGGQEENFVSFDVGDVFTLVSRDDDGWWRVMKNDKEMYVPASYMQVVESELEEDDGQVNDVVNTQLAPPDLNSPILNLSFGLDLPPPPESLLVSSPMVERSSSPLPPPPDDTSSEGELPDGWVELKSEDGATYYCNESTREVQWEKPRRTPQQSSESTRQPKNAGWQVETGEGGKDIYINPTTDEKWAGCTDSDGRTYYYSLTDVGKTAWELPDIRPVPSPRIRTKRSGSGSTMVSSNFQLPPPEAVQRTKRVSSDVSDVKIATSGRRSLKKRAPAPPTVQQPSNVSSVPSPPRSPEKTNSLRRNTYSPGHRRQLSAPTVQQFRTDMSLKTTDDSDPFLLPSGGNALTPTAVPSSTRCLSAPVGESEEPNVHKEFVGMSGTLQRKKLSDVGGKKCAQRNWSQHYVVLHSVHLLFYKDKKQAKDQKIGSKLNLPPTFCLQGAQLVVPDYSKRKNVMQLTSPTGEQMYLQADSSSAFVEWMNAFKVGISLANSMPPLNNRKQSSTTGLSFDENDPFIDDLIDAGGPDKKGRVRVKLKSFLARRPTYEEMKKKGFIKEQVFGSHIVHLAEREKTTVPAFVRLCIDAIELRGLDSIGIYRVPGNASQIQRLRYKIDREELVNLNDRKQWDDINVVAGALKLFFRELAEPLIPFAQFGPFLEIMRIPERELKIVALRKEMSKMHQANKDTLRVLLEHLKKVVDNGSVNKMLCQNIAIVFGPTLLRPEVETGNMAANMAFQNAIVDFFLREFRELFAK